MVIQAIARQAQPVVFMLWGAHAQSKAGLINGNVDEENRDRHLVLMAPHPSPLSAHRGFLGCGHFAKANVFLRQNHRAPIDWTDLPNSKK